MTNKEKTSPSIGSKASAVLRDPTASAMAKTIAASALSQTGTEKETSARVASIAGGALEDGRVSRSTHSLAASVLTQTPDKK